MINLRSKHGLPTAPLTFRLIDQRAAAPVDNPAFSSISRHRDRRFANA